MFHDDRLPNVGLRVLLGDKQQTLHLDLELNAAGEINLNQLVAIIRSTFQLQTHLLLFYLNHSNGTFHLIYSETITNVHFTSLVAQNNVTFRVEHKQTDELMANPIKQEEDSRTKRHRERVIQQAFLMVQQWRYFYRQGCLNEHGVKMKINLDQSAELVAVPRKTLEDYFLLFRIGLSQEFDFKKNRYEKVGILRSYIRQQGKKKNQCKQMDEKKFFRELRFELLGEKMQQELFDILNRSHSSSDQDMVFQH